MKVKAPREAVACTVGGYIRGAGGASPLMPPEAPAKRYPEGIRTI